MAVEQAVEPVAHTHARVRRIAICILIVVVIGAAATLFGWDLTGWLKEIWHTIKSVSVGYLIAGVVLLTVQTTTTAYAWYSILRYAYPDAGVVWRQVLAAYATAVALNFILPANLGTLVMLLMYTTIVAGATFAGVVAGEVVQKVFYSAIGAAVYLYLFLKVEGSFSLQLGFASEHPWAFAIVVVGGCVLIWLVSRMLRQRIRKWWAEAKVGGRILTDPRAYLTRVLAPEVISWVAMLGVIGVFLAAYNIPVTFDTLMRVVGGNSLANMTAATPGGAGVVQAFNTLSLKSVTSPANATAYSVAQQLVSTVWAIVLAIVLTTWAFGWSEGRALVTRSYAEAREKTAEEAAARKARRHARRHPQATGDAEV
jgi:uncharacterized membrane protein YbhN (UPF0104 family)